MCSTCTPTLRWTIAWEDHTVEDWELELEDDEEEDEEEEEEVEEEVGMCNRL